MQTAKGAVAYQLTKKSIQTFSSILLTINCGKSAFFAVLTNIRARNTPIKSPIIGINPIDQRANKVKCQFPLRLNNSNHSKREKKDLPSTGSRPTLQQQHEQKFVSYSRARFFTIFSACASFFVSPGGIFHLFFLFFLFISMLVLALLLLLGPCWKASEFPVCVFEPWPSPKFDRIDFFMTDCAIFCGMLILILSIGFSACL